MPASSGPDDRTEYLAEVSQILWPSPAKIAAGRSRDAQVADPDQRGGHHDLIVLPGPGRPRLIVPAGRLASAAAVRRYGEPGSAKTFLATRALAATLRAGAGRAFRGRVRVIVPDGAATIEAYLTSLLGQPIEISVHLGAPRANRKPVLQLLTPSGDTVGFAKIGVNELTARLIRAEHAALRQVGTAALTRLRPPEVLAMDRWQGLDVLVLSALPTWRRRRRLAPGDLARAVTELAHVAGSYEAPLADGSYWDRLQRRLSSAGRGADHDALRHTLPRLAGLGADATVDFGAWHGDLTPWNLASTRDELLVWDWERFATDVPVGFDALHYWLQEQVVSARRDPAAAAAECVRRAGALLGPLGVTPARARLTALAYLAELSVRYLADRQEEFAPRLGSPGRWLIPALRAGIDSA
ncbi:MAG: hypothetical protein ACYCVZ_00940 [Streptosporangiaceae bacterium]